MQHGSWVGGMGANMPLKGVQLWKSVLPAGHNNQYRFIWSIAFLFLMQVHSFCCCYVAWSRKGPFVVLTAWLFLSAYDKRKCLGSFFELFSLAKLTTGEEMQDLSCFLSIIFIASSCGTRETIVNKRCHNYFSIDLASHSNIYGLWCVSQPASLSSSHLVMASWDYHVLWWS